MLIDTDEHQVLRRAMVDREVVGKGIRDEAVIEAMIAVPRHWFVPEMPPEDAYGGKPLQVGCGQTISAPQMVALMTLTLRVRPGLRVLEVGGGTGYQAALLGRISGRVIAVERLPELAELAQARLDRMGMVGVRVVVGDGSLGYPTGAPYDRILVSAAAPAVPPALCEQLADGGVLVVPVGDRRVQTLTRLTRNGDAWTTEELGQCVFVPLLGEAGFEEGLG